MGSVTGPGSNVPPTVPQVGVDDQTQAAEAPKETPPEPVQTPDLASTAAAVAGEKKQEAGKAEKAKAAELHKEVKTEKGPLQGADPKTVLKEGSKGAGVSELQHQLNIWRKEHNLPPIKEDGKYGEETRKAVTEFQANQSHIETDGKAGPQTRDFLALANDPNFREVSSGTQAAVTGLLDSWKDNPAARTNLMQIVTDENFKKLDSEQQAAVLSRLSQSPETKHIGDLKDAMKEFAALKEDPNFKKLDPEVADSFTRAFFAMGPKTPEAREDLASIMKNENFANLPPDVQQKVGETFFQSVDNPEYTENLAALVGSKGFGSLGPEEQSRLLDAIMETPDPKFVSELTKLAGEGKLAGLDVDQLRESIGVRAPQEEAEASETGKEDPLAGLDSYMRGQIQGLYDSWKNNPTAQKNLMKIASDENFKKLDAEEQQAVLRKLMQNPETDHTDSLVQKMKEYVDLKSDPNYQKINPELRDNFTRLFFGMHPRSEEARQQLITLLKDKNFAALPPDLQEEIGKTFQSNADHPEYTKGLTELITSGAFSALDREAQSGLIKTIQDNADPRFVTELAKLARLGVLDDLGEAGVAKLLEDLGLSGKS